MLSITLSQVEARGFFPYRDWVVSFLLSLRLMMLNSEYSMNYLCSGHRGFSSNEVCSLLWTPVLGTPRSSYPSTTSPQCTLSRTSSLRSSSSTPQPWPPPGSPCWDPQPQGSVADRKGAACSSGSSRALSSPSPTAPGTPPPCSDHSTSHSHGYSHGSSNTSTLICVGNPSIPLLSFTGHYPYTRWL